MRLAAYVGRDQPVEITVSRADRVMTEAWISSEAACLAGYGSSMPSPVETVDQTYVRASGERDPAVRAKLIEACVADDARFVTRSAVIRGRAGVDAMIARFLADPQVLGFRVASAIDAAGTTFRYRSIVERRDGTSIEFFDAGEIDADGRIATLLVFSGPLADVTGQRLGTPDRPPSRVTTR